MRQAVRLSRPLLRLIGEQHRRNVLICKMLGQRIKQSNLCHLALRQRAKLCDLRPEHGARRAPEVVCGPIVAQRLDRVFQRAGFLPELALCGLERRFARLDVPALRLPGRARPVAAQQVFAVHVRKDHDEFVFPQRVRGENLACLQCSHSLGSVSAPGPGPAPSAGNASPLLYRCAGAAASPVRPVHASFSFRRRSTT